jgi:hypothetical protein
MSVNQIRHLFLDVSPPRANRALACERAAERVRADLAELVPFGAGLLIMNDAGQLDTPQGRNP